jgi:hypothetical protein
MDVFDFRESAVIVQFENVPAQKFNDVAIHFFKIIKKCVEEGIHLEQMHQVIERYRLMVIG